jgi:hypothetical protein
MNEQVARNVVLVRAIETADTRREILSDDDRMYASRSARELAQWQAADSGSAVTIEQFLQQRSEQILKRLAERTPAFGSFLQRRALLPSLSVVLPVLGLVAGAVADRIADPHRVDLLSAPLLLIIAWNLLVYLILIVWQLLPARETGWARPGMLRRLSVGKAALPRKLPAVLAEALTRFMAEWSRLGSKLARARLGRAVHLAAAAFALGAILSLYARGLLVQYVAGWESTFLEARQVHQILSTLFAPALFVFPLQGFSLADIEALRFTQTVSREGGARWVHLYAASLLLLVIMPRTLLALLATWRARRLARSFPIDLDEPYFRKLADKFGAAGPAVLRVLPYSFTVDEARYKGLAAISVATLGEQARLMLRPSCPYGMDPEETLQDVDLGDPGVALTAALFNLASTPEKENHGAFIDYLVRHSPRGIAVLVDESGLQERASAQAGFDGRLAERMALWRQFCHFHGGTATFVNLLHPDKYPLDAGAGLALSAAR